MQKLNVTEWFVLPLKMELCLLFRFKAKWVQPIIFFCLLVALFPLGLGQEAQSLPLLWPTLIWMAASLSALWSAEAAFQLDLENAAIEQTVLSPYPLWLWLFIRGIAYWLVIGLPITVLTPLLAYLFGLNGTACWVLTLSLLFGLPGICLLALIASSITLCLRNSGLLLVLMMLPLFIPFLILGIGSVSLSLMAMSAKGQLAWIGFLSLLVMTFGPFAGAQGIRYSLDD